MGTPWEVPEPRKTKQNDMGEIYPPGGVWPAERNFSLVSRGAAGQHEPYDKSKSAARWPQSPELS
jgi:hypothetical protein